MSERPSARRWRLRRRYDALAGNALFAEVLGRYHALVKKEFETGLNDLETHDIKLLGELVDAYNTPIYEEREKIQ